MTDVLSYYNHWLRTPIPTLTQPKYHPRKYGRQTLARPMHERLSRTPRKITLYRNGDRYFTGKQVTIIPQNYTRLRQFLHEVSNIVDLPYGVKRIYTPRNGSEVTDINSLRDGASYVCGAFEPFQKLEYSANFVPHITFNVEQSKFPMFSFYNYKFVRHSMFFFFCFYFIG